MPSTTLRSSRGVVTTVVTAALLGLLIIAAMTAGSGTATAATPPGPAETTQATGWIRVGHLSPGTPDADVRLTPYKGAAATTLAHVGFGNVTPYKRLPVGLYTVSLLPAGQGTDASASAMISRNVQVTEGSAKTVIATGEAGQVRATVLDDDLQAPPAGQAKVRLVSAATGTTGGVTARIVGGPLLAQDVSTGSSTGYATVKAQTWTVELQGSTASSTIIRRVPVRAGGTYTLVALDDSQGRLQLRAVKDAASSTSSLGAMPTGGVETGGGGLARTAHVIPSSGSALPAAGGVLLIALTLGAAAIWGDRTRRAR